MRALKVTEANAQAPQHTVTPVTCPAFKYQRDEQLPREEEEGSPRSRLTHSLRGPNSSATTACRCNFSPRPSGTATAGEALKLSEKPRPLLNLVEAVALKSLSK